MDAGAVGEVMETFAVSSNAVVCMAVAPTFDECDPDVLSSESRLVVMLVPEKNSYFGGNIHVRVCLQF